MEPTKKTIKNMQSYSDRESKVHFRALQLVKDNSRVLSAGCGPGREMKKLIEKNCDAVGIDIRDAMINESKKIAPNGKYILGSILEYQISDRERERERFDYILCLWNTINRFKKEDKKKFIKISYDNLKDNGILIITTKHKFSSFRIFLKSFQNKFENIYYYNPKEIKEWFEKTGFKYKIIKEDLGNLLIIAEKRKKEI